MNKISLRYCDITFKGQSKFLIFLVTLYETKQPVKVGFCHSTFFAILLPSVTRPIYFNKSDLFSQLLMQTKPKEIFFSQVLVGNYRLSTVA